MSKVSMINAGIRGFANAVKRMAVKNKEFAQELVFEHGLRGEITPNNLRKIGIVSGKYGKPQMYDEAGKLTKSGKAEVLRVAKDLNLSPTKATWDDALEAIGKFKKDKIELPKIPKVDLSLNLDKFKEPLTDSFKESIKKTIKKTDVPEDFKKLYLDIINNSKNTLKDILPDWLK